MPSRKKINLEKVRASLDAVCPKCGKLIPPAEVRRIDFEHIECPVCGEQFTVGNCIHGKTQSTAR
jgi:ribosomal protein L37AE/L43A